MPQVQVVHTSFLSAAELTEVRTLLESVFPGDFDEHDWGHSLGGMHVLARDSTRLVGHAALVQRRLLHAGRALRTGYVEGVGVHPERRGRGWGAALMAEIERMISRAYEIGALGSTEEALGFYARRGWSSWRGPTYALTPEGVIRTPDEDGGIHVFAAPAGIDLDRSLVCDWRDGALW